MMMIVMMMEVVSECVVPGNSNPHSSEFMTYHRCACWDWVGSILNCQIEEKMRASERMSRLVRVFQGLHELPAA